jgi:hypothetical protein
LFARSAGISQPVVLGFKLALQNLEASILCRIEEDVLEQTAGTQGQKIESIENNFSNDIAWCNLPV